MWWGGEYTCGRGGWGDSGEGCLYLGRGMGWGRGGMRMQWTQTAAPGARTITWVKATEEDRAMRSEMLSTSSFVLYLCRFFI